MLEPHYCKHLVINKPKKNLQKFKYITILKYLTVANSQEK